MIDCLATDKYFNIIKEHCQNTSLLLRKEYHKDIFWENENEIKSLCAEELNSILLGLVGTNENNHFNWKITFSARA